jgi:hypothetical protein
MVRRRISGSSATDALSRFHQDGRERQAPSRKVLITLFEKGLSWETKRVDLFKNEQYDPTYLKYNPKGVVPTLVHNDKPIVESTLICEYLDDTFPAPSLVPPSPYDRAQMRLWSKQIDEGIFEATREISFSAMFREKLRNMTNEQRNIRFNNVGDPGRSARFRSTYEHGTESPMCFMRLRHSRKCSGRWTRRCPMAANGLSPMI